MHGADNRGTREFEREPSFPNIEALFISHTLSRPPTLRITGYIKADRAQRIKTGKYQVFFFLLFFFFVRSVRLKYCGIKGTRSCFCTIAEFTGRVHYLKNNNIHKYTCIHIIIYAYPNSRRPAGTIFGRNLEIKIFLSISFRRDPKIICHTCK